MTNDDKTLGADAAAGVFAGSSDTPKLTHADLCGDTEKIGGATCRLLAGHDGDHWGTAAYVWPREGIKCAGCGVVTANPKPLGNGWARSGRTTYWCPECHRTGKSMEGAING